MENLSQFFSNLSSQISSFWQSLDSLKKFAIIAAITLIFAAIASALLVQTKPEQAYLFTDLTPEDIRDITSELQKIQVDNFTIDNKGILVPADQVLNFTTENDPRRTSSKGTIGWEKFDNQDFTRTEFEQNINKLRAIQGELARTIASIDGIISARVHIVTPEKALSKKTNKKQLLRSISKLTVIQS